MTFAASYAVGTDLVCISDFAAQLDTPGTRFEHVFSATELRVAATKGQPGSRMRAQHLAGRWAAKEAFIKAWSQLLYGTAPAIAADAVDFSLISIRPDAWGRVAVELEGELARAVEGSIGQHHAALSISHDGDYATATVVIQRA